MFCHRWARVSSEKPGLWLGDRKRLKLAITHLGEMPSEPATHRALAGPNAERRQLTVAFVDLVDSTALSRVLDPEDLRDAMRAYHLAVANVIREAQGFVAQFLGGRRTRLFRLPARHRGCRPSEPSRASLRAVAAVKELPAANGHALLARAAVATGPVVVGKLIGGDVGRELNVVGETPNLAARLLALGPPGAVIVADSTRRLIGEAFHHKGAGAADPEGVRGACASLSSDQ